MKTKMFAKKEYTIIHVNNARNYLKLSSKTPSKENVESRIIKQERSLQGPSQKGLNYGFGAHLACVSSRLFMFCQL